MKIAPHKKYLALSATPLLLACCLIGFNLSRDRVGNDAVFGTSDGSTEKNAIAAQATLRSQRTRIPLSDENAHGDVDSFVVSKITEQPFTLNGLSPIANASFGFSAETVHGINQSILDTRIKTAQLFVDNMKLVAEGRRNGRNFVHYEYQADLDKGIGIKNELIENINTITSGSFDQEIEQLLGGCASFLYCGTVNVDFIIFSDPNPNGEGKTIEIMGQTTDGHTVIPRYQCNLNSFTRSTLIEFDQPK